MKAIILAAGKATRLLPLTKDTPQCLLRVGKKTILERQIEYLNNAGIKDIIVIRGYLEEKVEKFCKEKKIRVLFNPFYNVSGMAMTLWVAKEELKNGFILLYSDVIFNPKIIEDLVDNKSDICLTIRKDGLREEAEKVIEKGGLIENVTKAKIEGENGEFIGIAKFSESGAKKLIEEIGGIAKENLNASFIDVIGRLIKRGEKISACDIKNTPFIDIDFPKDLEKAEKLF